MREKITFFISYYSAIKKLPREKQIEAFEAILDYAFNNEENTEDPFIAAMLELMKPNIDRSNEISDSASARGKQGGRPKANESYEKLTKANESCEKLTKAEEEVEVEEEKEKEYTTLNPPTGGQSKQSIIRHRFEEFWKVYPKKRSKEAAYRRFCKINPSEELLQTMIRAVEKQAKTDQWRKNDGDFIPYPATWLNSGAWMDQTEIEIIAARPSPPKREPNETTFRDYGYQSWEVYRQAYLSGYEEAQLWR